MRTIMIVGVLLMQAGCALGVGGGVGVSVDTRGRWMVLATVSVDNLGIRVEPKKTPETEQAPYLMHLAVSGGAQIAPLAGVVRLDVSGGSVWSEDHLDAGWGYDATLAFRNEMIFPDEGKSTYAVGGVVKGAWYHHLKKTQLERVSSRPEWPDGWELHRLGPGGEVAILHDDEGWYGQFTLQVLYEWLNYFYIGL